MLTRILPLLIVLLQTVLIVLIAYMSFGLFCCCSSWPTVEALYYVSNDLNSVGGLYGGKKGDNQSGYSGGYWECRLRVM